VYFVVVFRLPCFTIKPGEQRVTFKLILKMHFANQAVLIALFVNVFIAQAAMVENGPSMQPNLYVVGYRMMRVVTTQPICDGGLQGQWNHFALLVGWG
jgi:hypothetical protein